MTYSENDNRFMAWAVEEAHNDPRQFKVGALIVTRNQEVIRAHGGEDPERKEHAEHRAIHKCLGQIDLKGATLYTTLEPCVEHARSPGHTPCAVEILTSEIDRVVVGIIDTDGRVRGNGAHKLRQGGIVVDVCTDPNLRTTIQTLMAPFLKQERPRFRAEHSFPLTDIFVGRVAQREMLTDWLCLKGGFGSFPVLVLHGLGGAGKSSLAWLWANRDVAGIDLPLPRDAKEVEKRCAVERGWRVGLNILWFSFYQGEGGSTFTRFLEAAIGHFSIDRSPRDYLVSEKVDYDDLARELHNSFNNQRCLLIWDGAERLLWEYSGSSSVLEDSPRRVPREYVSRGRMCIDPHVARFVLGLTRQIHSKLLILSRVPFADLEGHPAVQIELEGLEPDTSVAFLRKRGVRGPDGLLRKRARDYEFHALSLSNLAAAVIEDYESTGNIADAPSFDPGIPKDRRRRHVLRVAFQKRSPALRQLLSRLATVRGLIRKDVVEYLTQDLRALDNASIGRAINELIRHGLLRRAGTASALDMHPLVRGYAYKRLSGKRKDIHERLSHYYRLSRETLRPHDPLENDWVAAAVEFFYHTARTGRFQNAMEFFKKDEDSEARNLNHILFYELCDLPSFVDLLTEMFPGGVQSQPVVDEDWKVTVLNDLSLAYLQIGDPNRAEELLGRGVTIALKQRRRLALANLPGVNRQLALCREGLGDVRSSLGKLREAYHNLVESIALYLQSDRPDQVIYPLRVLGKLLSTVGRHQEFESIVGEMLTNARYLNPKEYYYDVLFAENSLLRGQLHSAATHLKTAKERFDRLPVHSQRPRFRAKIDCLGGEIALASGNLPVAEDCFNSALRQARMYWLAEFELKAILGLGGTSLEKSLDNENAESSQFSEATDLATEALLYAERCGFALLQADAHNLFARIALKKGKLGDAKRHATTAMNLSLCGLKRPKKQSFYYVRGYREAARYLKASTGESIVK